MLQTKIITVSELTQGQTSNGKAKISLKDEKGLTYTIYVLKNDGQETVAFQNFKEHNFTAIGKSFDISYDVKEGEIEGRNVEFRTIANIKIASATPVHSGVDAPLPTSQNSTPDVLAMWNELKTLRIKVARLEGFHGVINVSEPLNPVKVEQSNQFTDEQTVEFINEHLGSGEVKLEDIPF